MLTKSAYLAYIQCPLQSWLRAHQPGLAAPPDPAVQRRLQAGMEVERLARSLSPEGVHIPYRPHPEDMVSITAEVMADGAPALFQGSFAADDLLIKTDILSRTERGWHLIEVKSATRVKEAEHLPDIAFQLYVLQKYGLEVAQASIMHLNRECRYPDFANLFLLTDVTEGARSLLHSIETDVIAMCQIQNQPEPPNAGIGRHCSKPRTCPFYEHCWRDIDGLTIYDIARLNKQKEQQLRSDGVLYLADIPQDFPLTPNQWGFVDFIVQEQINIDRAAIRRALDDLEYPLYFFDFETIDHAVPVFNGCSPYQQVPFQYSCHVLRAAGDLSHHEYLHTDAGDPRLALIEAMLNDIGPTGHIVAYYAPFERGVFFDLAAAFPRHHERLVACAERLWDQLDIFKRYYRHHAFGKSNSLKSVMPVVVPELSYDPLSIQDGGQAQVAWEQMIACEDQDEKDHLIHQLLAYCRMDTLAMVRIHQVLSGLDR